MSEAETDAQLLDALAQSAFVVTAVLSRIGAENDLSLTQLRVLGILQDRRLRMSDLSDYLGLDKSTISGMIDRAEKRGLVERAANRTDRRATDVLMTSAGTELAQRIFTHVADSLRPLTAGLPPADRSRLQTLLTTMLATAPQPGSGVSRSA